MADDLTPQEEQALQRQVAVYDAIVAALQAGEARSKTLVPKNSGGKMSDSGAVERNVAAAAEALERARIRNNSSTIPASPPASVTGTSIGSGPIMQSPRPTGTHEGSE